MVLKVARRLEDNERVESEFRALKQLQHSLIVSAHERDPLRFSDGRVGFLMDYAGKGTLAQELKDVGRLSLEFLQRYGEDLLQVVVYLEEMGIAHRDLKPGNIGIQEYGKNLQRRLKVFDFSLSATPFDQVRAGTPPYLEPFLQLPGRGRWDTAAERYAASVILYEMATGTTPRWGDGQSAPHLIDAEATIEADLIDPPVREALHGCFTKCFKRDPRRRFDNASEMFAAWHEAFARAAASDSHTTDERAQSTALESVRADTLVSQLGLSTRAQNTLDRLNLFTAQELAAQPPGRFSNLRGVGNKTRREIMDLIGKLRARLPQSPIPGRAPIPTPESAPEDAEVPTLPLSVDQLAALLIPVESSPSGKASRNVLSQVLGLDDVAGLPPWPTQAVVVGSTGRGRAQVNQILAKARERWRRTPPLTEVRTQLHDREQHHYLPAVVDHLAYACAEQFLRRF